MDNVLASGYMQACAPEFVLTAVAVLVLLFGVFGRGRGQWLLFLLAAGGIIGALVAILGLPGGASLPGIKAGMLATYTRMITLAFGLLLLLITWHLPEGADRGEFVAMVLFSTAGAMLTGLADDLIVLLIALELVSMPTYVLVATARRDLRAQEAGMKYFFLGAMASALTAYGFSFLYGVGGTTNLSTGAATITATTLANSDHFFVIAGLAISILGLSFKVAAVPLHFYVADVYEGAAAPVTAMLGFMPKLAGFVAMAKVLATVGGNLPEVVFWLLWGMAAATMIVGNVLALMQTNVKRILAYSSVAHSGYMLVALLVGPVAHPNAPIQDGVAAMLFYIALYGATNLGAFAIVGMLRVRAGTSEAEQLDDLAGLSLAYPGAALMMAVCAFSLMGMPPTGGFVGKLYIFGSAMSLDSANEQKYAMIVLAIIGVLTSAVGAAYYLRIVAACYLRQETGELRRVPCGLLKLGAALAAIIVIAAGLAPGRLMAGARQSSGDLLPPPKPVQTQPSAAQPSKPSRKAPAVKTPTVGKPTTRKVGRPSTK